MAEVVMAPKSLVAAVKEVGVIVGGDKSIVLMTVVVVKVAGTMTAEGEGMTVVVQLNVVTMASP